MQNIIRPVISIVGPGYRAQFTEARLMSPQEVSANIHAAGTTSPARFNGHWFICGDCSTEFFEQVVNASANEVAVEYRMSRNSRGAEFLVITHQFESLQHRFLLPLWASRVPDFIEAIDRGVAGFSFGNNGSEEAALLGDEPMKDFAIQVLAGHQAPTAEQATALVEAMPEAVQLFSAPNTVPSIVEGREVSEVSLSVLIQGIPLTGITGDTNPLH